MAIPIFRHQFTPYVQKWREFVRTGRRSILGGLISWDKGYYTYHEMTRPQVCAKCGAAPNEEVHQLVMYADRL